jgi:hypothetical protein
LNLKISVWCNTTANRVQVTPIVPTGKAANHTSFFLIDGVWWSKKSGTLKPDAHENDISHAQWMWKMRDECIAEVEEFVGRSCEDSVNGEAVYYFPTEEAAIEFANGLALDCETFLRG